MVYLWSMGVVAATALPMALYRPVLFLAMVAVFSFYAAFSGYRVLKLKDLARGGTAKPIDWFAGAMTFCSSACLAGFGWLRPAWVQHMGLVAIIFGLLGMRLAFVQMLSFVRKPKEKMFWWYTHPRQFHWQLHRRLDCLLCSDTAEAAAACRLCVVVMANRGRRPRHCDDDRLL